MDEATLWLNQAIRWKELSIEGMEYETTKQETMAELQFDLNVAIDKMKEKKRHQERMQLNEMKKDLTKDFVKANTERVTTTTYGLFSSETKETSRTIFHEWDTAFFCGNMLSQGFDGGHAIDAPEGRVQGQILQIEQGKREEIEIGVDGNKKRWHDDGEKDFGDAI